MAGGYSHHGESRLPAALSQSRLAPVAPPRLTRFTIARDILVGRTRGSPLIVAVDEGGQRFLVATGGSSVSRLAALYQGRLSSFVPGARSSSPPPAASSSSSPPPAASSSSSPPLAASSPSLLAPRPPPASPRCELLVCDVRDNSALWLPNDGVDVVDADNVGILTAPGVADNFLVAELRFNAAMANNLPDATCSLRRYGSSTGEWTTTVLAHPQPGRQHRTDGIFARGDRLWWVNFASGLYNLNPFVDDPVIQFVELPLFANCNSESSRYCNVSNGEVVFAMIAHESVKIWALGDAESGAQWMPKYTLALADILANSASGLQERIPGVVVHPYEPYVIYLCVKNYIVTVNLKKRKISELITEGLAMRPQSSGLVLVWPMPQLLPEMLRLFRAVPQQRILNSVSGYVQTILAIPRDGESAYHLGVQLSNIAEQMTALNTGVTEGYEYVNQVMPYVELSSRLMGEGPMAASFQSSLPILKYICEMVGKANSGLAIGARLCSTLGLELQRRHPNVQTGARSTPSHKFTVRTTEEASAIITAWKQSWLQSDDPISVDIAEDLGRDDARLIYNMFRRYGAFDLIKEASILHDKIQDGESEWFIL